MNQQYFIFDEKNLAEFIWTSSWRDAIGAREKSEVTCSEIGDGNLNSVFKCSGPQRTIIIKQALPYIRCIGESWPLTIERAKFEYSALRKQFELCPHHTPEVFLYDPQVKAFCMRFIEPPHCVLRSAMICGTKYTSVGKHIASFLANTLFKTSGLYLSASELRNEVENWSRNHEMCKQTEQVFFSDPYVDSELNRWTSPQLNDIAASIKKDLVLKLEVADMKKKFVCSTEALLHGDLHTGSIMVKEDSTLFIDPEFAFYGPIGFDVGCIVANFLLSFFSQSNHRLIDEPNSRALYAEWILCQLAQMYMTFEEIFLDLWDHSERGDTTLFSRQMFDGPEFEEATAVFMRRVFEDSVGFASVEMIRRIVGVAHVADMETIESDDDRSQCERRALLMAIGMMKQRSKIKSIDDIVQMAKEHCSNSCSRDSATR